MKNLWSSGLPSPADYVRSLKLLLEGLTLQTEELNSPEITVLREEVVAVANGLTVQTTAKTLADGIESAIQSLCRFSSSSAARVATHLNELKATMRALTQTVAFLSESRSTVVHQLTFIERQLEQASELEDIRLLRPKLMKCLELVREETARLQSESSTNSESIRNNLGKMPQAGERPRRLGSLDPVTGLPAREAAQRLIEDKITAGKESVVALFLPDRLESIGRHHGSNAADEVLLQVAHHLAKNILPPACLFRWSDAAFLALVEAPQRSADVTRAWKSLASKAVDLTINLDRRSLLVSVSTFCVVKTINASTNAAALIDELDKSLKAA